MKRSILSLVAISAVVAAPAMAADLRMPVKAPYAPPAPTVTWTGCYIDGGLGYGLWDADHFGGTSTGPFNVSSSSGGRGWLGRVGAGCDYQITPSWVVGVFGDYDFMGLKGNFVDANGLVGGVQSNMNESAAWAVGGRLGYVLAPGILTYVDGGYTETRFDAATWTTTTTGALTGIGLAKQTFNGWFIGGGTETSLASWLPGLPSGLFLRTEYRFSSYDAANVPVVLAGGPPVVITPGSAENIKPYVQTVTTSLVWRFNFGR